VPITHEDVRVNFILADLAEQSWRQGRPMAVRARP